VTGFGCQKLQMTT